MHERAEKGVAPKAGQAPRFVRDVPAARIGGGCIHCHQVREILDEDARRRGDWTRDRAFRWPLPENLGFSLEVDRGNVVRKVEEKSPAARAGLMAGDVVQRIGNVPVHSFADAQFALDRAPVAGDIDIAWQRGGTGSTSKLSLPEGWRKTDITWRTSMRRLVPAARLLGVDLKPEEKRSLGLGEKQLAFRQQASVSRQAQAAGVQAGDIIIGVDDRYLEMDELDFSVYIRTHYLIGDTVTVNLLRDGKRLNLPMRLVVR
jgi:S1-C subfamily serine protease